MILDSDRFSIWEFSSSLMTTKGTLWDLQGVFNTGKWSDIVSDIRPWGEALLIICLGCELIRLYLRSELFQAWKVVLFKFAMLAILISSPSVYNNIMTVAPNIADGLMKKIATSDNCDESAYMLFDGAKSAAINTFDPASSKTLNEMSVENALFGGTQTLFYLIWFTVPYMIVNMMRLLFLVGPIFLPFGIFFPLSGIATSWAKAMVAFPMSLLMVCTSFFLMMSAGILQLTLSAQQVADLYLFLPLVWVQAIIAFVLPGFCIRLIGTPFNLLKWKVV